MGKVTLNSSQLRRIVESTVRVVLNEGYGGCEQAKYEYSKYLSAADRLAKERRTQEAAVALEKAQKYLMQLSQCSDTDWTDRTNIQTDPTTQKGKKDGMGPEMFGRGREFGRLAEAYKSSKIRDIMNRNGGAKNRYDQPEDPKLADDRVTQDGMGDITDDDIVYVQEYDNVKDAQSQAWELNHPRDNRGDRGRSQNTYYTVYKTKNGKGVVVGIDKKKVETGSTWGGELTKKLADRVMKNGWNFKTRSNRYVDDSDTYYTNPTSPAKDFGYRTNHDFKNMQKDLENSKKSYEEQPYKDAMWDAKFDKNPKSAAKNVEKNKEALMQQGRDNYKDWRQKELDHARDYVQRYYPKYAKK